MALSGCLGRESCAYDSFERDRAHLEAVVQAVFRCKIGGEVSARETKSTDACRRSIAGHLAAADVKFMLVGGEPSPDRFYAINFVLVNFGRLERVVYASESHRQNMQTFNTQRPGDRRTFLAGEDGPWYYQCLPHR